MELSTSAPLLISPSCLVPTVFAGRLPQPTRLPPPDGHAAFTALQVLFGRPTPRRASLPTSLSLIGSVAAAPPAGPAEVSQGHALVFHTVPPANTLVRWVDEIAFASVVQARPCPTFGRPVRHGVAPSTTARYCSANPSDPTSRWAPCPPQFRRGGSRSTLAVSGFRLRARVGVSIPATCGRRGITPAFGYGPPHPGAGGTSTLLTSALPGAHYTLVRLTLHEQLSGVVPAIPGSHSPDLNVSLAGGDDGSVRETDRFSTAPIDPLNGDVAPRQIPRPPPDSRSSRGCASWRTPEPTGRQLVR